MVDDDDALVARLRAAGCVFAEDEAGLLRVAASTPADLEALVRRRVAGEPLEYVLGWAEFCGLRIGVWPGVFVPRRRTEFLVATAAGLIEAGAVVVDLGCGSGAVGLALAAAVPGIELYAVDVEPVAVRCAAANLAGTGTQGHQVYLGDLYDPLPGRLRGRVDLLAVNAPYVPTAQVALMPREARDYEPAVTLDGGRDGLDVHRRVAAGARDWLAPHGQLVIEVSRAQAPVAAELFAAHGLHPQIVTDDDRDATVVVGRNFRDGVDPAAGRSTHE